MKTVACWLWGGRGYEPRHVNVLHRMFRRHLAEDHRFVCITDEPRRRFGPGIEVMPTPESALSIATLPSPEGRRFPSCYRRLWMFSQDAMRLGERVMLTDIDVVLTGDVSHLLTGDADFVGWRPRMSWGHNSRRIGGGLYVMRPGSRAHVWEEFNGARSIAEARRAGYRGSDQAWMSYQLRGCALMSQGIYSIRDLRGGHLPGDACLVQFNGPTKPWHSTLPWVREHWR